MQNTILKCGIENFDVKREIEVTWKNIKGITLRQIILCKYKSYITWIDDNTIEINCRIYLDNCGLTNLDTDGLKVIVNYNLYLKDNTNLTSFKGIDNWDVKGFIHADWENIKDISLKDIILYQNKTNIKWIDDNTIEINDNLYLTEYGLTSLNTDGLKVIVNGFLNLKYNPELTSLKGIENFEVKGEIYKDF